MDQCIVPVQFKWQKRSKNAVKSTESQRGKRESTPLTEADTDVVKRVKIEGEKSKSIIDFDNADFSQYSCGTKGQTKQFNPWNELGKKGKMNQKGRTGFKGGSKTFHYKKSK